MKTMKSVSKLLTGSAKGYFEACEILLSMQDTRDFDGHSNLRECCSAGKSSVSYRRGRYMIQLASIVRKEGISKNLVIQSIAENGAQPTLAVLRTGSKGLKNKSFVICIHATEVEGVEKILNHYGLDRSVNRRRRSGQAVVAALKNLATLKGIKAWG